MAEKIMAFAAIGSKRGSDEPSKVTGWVDVPIHFDRATFALAAARGIEQMQAAMMNSFDEATKGKTFDAIERTWK